MQYSIRLIGAVTGTLWWPAAQAGKDVSIDLSGLRTRMVGGKVTLRDLLLRAACEEGGDFSGGAQFTADTQLVITSRKGKTTRTRAWDITTFPSVADLVNAEVYSGDFCCEEE